MDNTINQTLPNGPSYDRNKLSSWSLKPQIRSYYERRGITRFFDWQVEALLRPGVFEGRNLVYSAPTSAGKSMVADILLFNQVIDSQKKAIVILPFVSIAQEKVNSLKSLFRQLGLRIESFAGNVNPRGGLQRVDVAVCTIEKANNMINRLIEEDELEKVGIIVVDELHMLGDESRGYLLELLLTKLRFLAQTRSQTIMTPQIVGMSATIPNLPEVASWLEAELYVTDFRPVPLYERLVVDQKIFQTTDFIGDDQPPTNLPVSKAIRDFESKHLSISSDNESDIVYLSIETIVDGYSCLIFGSTKSHCEKLAKTIAKNIYEIGADLKRDGSPEALSATRTRLRTALSFEKIKALIDALKRCVTGLDASLETVVRYGVAFHHAGLSTEERALLECAFRDGTLRILCSTTTLSAGVNLPARRVMICSPFDYRRCPLNATSYRQMIGRAGRKGIDTLGEAMLFSQQRDLVHTVKVISSQMKPVKSSLACTQASPVKRTSPEDGNSVPKKQIRISEPLRRATLEAIVDGLVSSVHEIQEYFQSTFFFHSSESSQEIGSTIQETIECLRESQLIYDEVVSCNRAKTHDFSLDNTLAEEEEQTASGSFLPSPFGRAVIASGVPPDQGSFLMNELNRARSNLCLVNDLHLIYLVTPTYFHRQMVEVLNWSNYYRIFLKMNEDMRLVAKVVGIEEGYIVNRLGNHMINNELYVRYTRFFVSLALFELVQEVPLLRVASDFGLTKGMVQSLQQQAAQFAGMLTTFCDRLGWSYLEMLIEQIQKRLSFGVQRELIDLMRIPCLTSQLARRLYEQKCESVVSLVMMDSKLVEKALITTTPFVKKNAISQKVEESKKEETLLDPATTKIFIPNLEKYVTIRRLAKMIIRQARRLIESEVGPVQFSKDNVSDVSSEEDAARDKKPDHEKIIDVVMKSPVKSQARPGVISLSEIDFNDDAQILDCLKDDISID